LAKRTFAFQTMILKINSANNHIRVPSFILSGAPTRAPERMKVGTVMSLPLETFCEDTRDPVRCDPKLTFLVKHWPPRIDAKPTSPLDREHRAKRAERPEGAKQKSPTHRADCVLICESRMLLRSGHRQPLESCVHPVRRQSYERR
jgi:hypothetical protein